MMVPDLNSVLSARVCYLLHFLMAETGLQELVLVEHFGIGTMCRLYYCVHKAQAGGLWSGGKRGEKTGT